MNFFQSRRLSTTTKNANVSLLHALSRISSLFRPSPSFSGVAELLAGEGEPGGGFRGGTIGVSLSRLSPIFLVAHGRRGERTRARFCGVAHRRAREQRGEGRGCSQSVPKTFTIARLGSLALALSLGLCLMAYLPMWVAHNTKMYGCAGRGPAWSLTHLLPYSIAKPKAYSVPNAERTNVPSRLPVVFVRHFGLVLEISAKESAATLAIVVRRCHSFQSTGCRSTEGDSGKLVS